MTKFIIKACCIFLISSGVHARLEVFACEPEWAALTKIIGANHVSVYSATKAGEDPHYIQAKPGLIKQLKSADLLFCSGAGLEQNWLPKLMKKAANQNLAEPKAGHLMAAETVQLLEVGGEHDGGIHASGNPHLHLNPHNISRVASTLSERLKRLDTANAKQYDANLQVFLDAWQTAIQRWEEQAKVLQGVAIVVNHENWAYLNDWLGMRQVSALESKPGIAPSSAYLAGVLAHIKALPTKMIITAAHQDVRAAQWLSERSGLPVLVLPYTVGGNAQAKDLFALFDNIIAKLTQQLK